MRPSGFNPEHLTGHGEHVQLTDRRGNGPSWAADAEQQLTSPGLRQEPLLRALADPPELRFAQRALEPEEQAVIGQAGIVDAFAIDDEGPGQPAEVEELVVLATNVIRALAALRRTA